MKFFKKSAEELEEERDYLQIESEVVGRKAEIAEKESVIKQLKREHGPRWMQVLGISKSTDLSTLKSFLTSSKNRMEKSAAKMGNPRLSPLVRRR